MIQIFKICELVKDVLNEAKGQGVVSDFRIVLRYNERLHVYLVVTNNNDETDRLESKLHELYSDIETEFYINDTPDLLPSVFDSDPQSGIMFENGRRRLDSFSNYRVAGKGRTPVVTFYSFKGGQGRSTTLAAFASYLAIRHTKKVFIIDCDIEAPGFNNFFTKGNDGIPKREGFVEYLLDKSTGLTEAKQLMRYVRQADTMYAGDGNIYIMDAGNLDGEFDTNDFLHKNLFHYLEGLARLDLNNNYSALEILQSLISDIEQEYSPDVILIDSRTGFNDIMGLFAHSLSQVVVGFFRSDSQSLPGMQHFISTLAPRTDIETFIVNSILPSPGRLNKSLFNAFKETLEEVKDNAIAEINKKNDGNRTDASDLFDRIKAFPLSRRDELELVGSSEEDPEDFVNLSSGGEYSDYDRLFSAITNIIETPASEDDQSCEEYESDEDKSRTETEEVPVKSTASLRNRNVSIDLNQKNRSLFDIINCASEKGKKDSAIQWREDILSSANDTLNGIDLYAERVDIEKKYRDGQFFLRECMKDLFNTDKYLILGSKGTGKSYLYKALRSKMLVEVIKQYARKDDDYIFINAIDKKSQIFNTKKFGEKDFLFRQNFWLLFSWLTIARMLPSFAPNFKKNPSIDIPELKDDNKTLKYLTDTIKNQDKILMIEDEYRRLDEYLLNRPGCKQILTILYDQLDDMVQPEIWPMWIPPLMELWRSKHFNRIFGKLFLRRDLFKKMRGLTNIKDIENQAIDIEWKREEVYSFFFKTILVPDIIDRFWGTCYISEPQEQKRIKDLRQHYKSEENRFRLDNYYLRPLVDIFFGVSVKTKSIRNLGESYYWLYDNLKNADDTISLRPFIDHIKASIELWKSDAHRRRCSSGPKFVILPPDYYTDKIVRKNSVERHIEDYVKESGNYPIKLVFDFFINAPSPDFKFIKLSKQKFENALEMILEKSNSDELLAGQSVKSLTDLMVANGIISKETNRKGDYYKFAHLYKYYLGLTGGMAPNEKESVTIAKVNKTKRYRRKV